MSSRCTSSPVGKIKFFLFLPLPSVPVWLPTHYLISIKCALIFLLRPILEVKARAKISCILEELRSTYTICFCNFMTFKDERYEILSSISRWYQNIHEYEKALEYGQKGLAMTNLSKTIQSCWVSTIHQLWSLAFM